MPESSLAVALMRLLKVALKEYGILDNLDKWKPEDTANKIDMVFLYCLIWTVSGTID